MRAIVVWHGHGTHFLDRFLKPGFKHCFVAVEADGQWVTLDGRAGLPMVEIVAPSSYDLSTFYRSRGYAVMETEQRGRVPLSPFLPRNCVGLVKGVLAIGAVLAITPWQLYCHMARAESPGVQLLPGESNTAPDRPNRDKKTLLDASGLVPGAGVARKARERQGGDAITIERRKKATFDAPEEQREDRREDRKIRDLKVPPADGGPLGGGDKSTLRKPSKDDERRGARAAAILGTGAGSEGIRDKLGRSGRRGSTKSLG